MFGICRNPQTHRQQQKSRKIDHVSSRWSCHRGLVIGMCNDAPANDGHLFRGTFFLRFARSECTKISPYQSYGYGSHEDAKPDLRLGSGTVRPKGRHKENGKKPWPRARVSRMILPISPAGRVLFLQQHHASRDSSLNCPSLPPHSPRGLTFVVSAREVA